MASRLFGVWQWVYKISQDYKEDFRGFKKDDGSEEGGEEQLSIIMSKIQTALQATGEKLEEGPALLNHTGKKQPFIFSSWVGQVKRRINERFSDDLWCLGMYG